MKKVNTAEVKARFAEYLERAVHGERVVIHRYNEPVAELRAITPSRTEPRPIGPVTGRPTFDLPPSFFEPIGENDLHARQGAAAAVYPPPGANVRNRRPAAARSSARPKPSRPRAKRTRS